MIKQLVQIHREKPLTLYTSTKEWAKAYVKIAQETTPFQQALIGGFSCKQFCFAFLAGYQAALETMFPTVAPGKLKALCVSEADGGHPKAIQTTLSDYHLSGIKTYVTAGTDVEHLIVLAKTNELVHDRPLLKMVHLPVHNEHVEITNFELAFMKEIKHGKVTLSHAKISPDQILEGDGFGQYAKPFRTYEDLLVGTAYHAMLLRQALEYQWEEELRDQILFNMYTLKNLLDLPPSDKETHLLLAAHEKNFEGLIPGIEKNIATQSPQQFQEDWETNKRVMFLGKKVKEIRLTKARKEVFGGKN